MTETFYMGLRYVEDGVYPPLAGSFRSWIFLDLTSASRTVITIIYKILLWKLRSLLLSLQSGQQKYLLLYGKEQPLFSHPDA